VKGGVFEHCEAFRQQLYYTDFSAATKVGSFSPKLTQRLLGSAENVGGIEGGLASLN
jgi:hypothetical protein